MLPDMTTNNSAPDDLGSIVTMQDKAFCAIMELTDEEKIRVLSKYAEKYGWSIF